MAAAVADYRPSSYAQQKLKKRDGTLTLELERTTDILADIAARPVKERPSIVAGFAAETEDLIANAEAKLRAKRLDLIVANDVSRSDSGFQVATNQATLLWADGRREPLPLMAKEQLAEEIVTRIAVLWEQRHE